MTSSNDRFGCKVSRPGRDWFERITGFREDGFESTQSRLHVDGDELVSAVNGNRYQCGTLALPTLAELRTQVNQARGQRSSVASVVGDARALHTEPDFAGALFQVASQFNLLEMIGPDVRPEDGVTGYASDRTQGPACAIAAGAATIYRNYLVPVDGGVGQRSGRQLNGLAHLGETLSSELGMSVDELWEMRNGYALCTRSGLEAIAGLLADASDEHRDSLRGQLAIGLHSNAQVTDVPDGPRTIASQAFCSALPVRYSPIPPSEWEPFARLVLEAAYEATLLAAAAQVTSGGSTTVLL